MKEKVSSKRWKWTFCTIAKLRMSTEFFILLYCFMFKVNRKLLEFIIFYLLIWKTNILSIQRTFHRTQNQNKLLKHQLYNKVFYNTHLTTELRLHRQVIFGTWLFCLSIEEYRDGADVQILYYGLQWKTFVSRAHSDIVTNLVVFCLDS